MAETRKSFFHLRHPQGNLPVYFNELGNSLQIAGIILCGNDLDCLLYLPDEKSNYETRKIYPDRDEWQAILKYMDDPQFFELDSEGNVKAVHRKCMRKVAGGLQWEIYYRDGFKCMYCKKPGGKNGLILTIDHFMPVEMGGTDMPDNLLTACRKCNKVKSDNDPKIWCNSMNSYLDYQEYIDYLNKFRK